LVSKGQAALQNATFFRLLKESATAEVKRMVEVPRNMINVQYFVKSNNDTKRNGKATKKKKIGNGKLWTPKFPGKMLKNSHFFVTVRIAPGWNVSLLRHSFCFFFNNLEFGIVYMLVVASILYMRCYVPVLS
jgi:hypothetical protein